jgi:oligopeptide/dipeptide ABC transporter ATP-binding protein
MTTLNPVIRIGDQLVETIRAHRRVDRTAATAKARELLEAVRIPDVDQRLRQYAVQLSGGMRQRVMLALALANEPQLIIADEPTTALDVTIQAQVLELLDAVRRRVGASVVLVTHDLGVIAELADRVVVMYAGTVVEQCEVDELFDHPAHHYTIGLLHSRPQLVEDQERLTGISGSPPNPGDERVPGCPFQPRCERGRDEVRCRDERPLLVETSPAHWAACHFPVDDAGGS